MSANLYIKIRMLSNSFYQFCILFKFIREFVVKPIKYLELSLIKPNSGAGNGSLLIPQNKYNLR